MSTLDYRRRKAFVNALVADTNLQYKEHENLGAGYTERGVINMPLYRPEFTEEQNQRWMMQLLDNAYHNLPDNVGDVNEIVRQGIDLDTPFGQALAMVSKHNCQNKRQGIYPGADEYVSNAYQHDHSQFINDQLDSSIPDLPPELEAVKAFDMSARSKWQLASDWSVRDTLTPVGRDYYDNLMSKPELMDEYLTGREGGENNIQLTKKLIEQMHDDEQEGQDKAEQMAQEAGADGESSEESNEQQQGEGNSKGEGKSGEGEAGEGEENEGEKATGEDSETEYRQLNENDGISPDQIGSNKKIKYQESDFNTGEHFKPCDTKVVVPEGSDTGRAEAVLRKMSFGLSTKIRNILKVYSQARYTGGKKRGKINKRKLATVVNGNDRIFRTKEVRDTLDTAVFVLVDTSGSMSGSKYTNAAAAAGMLNDCLGKLNIPHAVFGFSYYDEKNVMIQHKDFGEKKLPEDMANNFCSTNVYMAGNADGEAVLWAHDHLLRQKQKRKVLIVLSDGSPAGHGEHNEVGYLQHVVRDIESKSPVELYGIGIQDRNVKRFYTNNVVLSDSRQLEDKLLEVTKNFMVN